MTDSILFSKAFTALNNAGFEVQEACHGSAVVGLNVRKGDEVFICGHNGTGWYSQAKVDAIIAGTGIPSWIAWRAN